MGMKWCCVVAFSKISRMRMEMWWGSLMPQVVSCSNKESNFSTVSLFRMDRAARTTFASSSGVLVVSRLRCCASHESSATSGKAKGATLQEHESGPEDGDDGATFLGPAGAGNSDMQRAARRAGAW